MMIERALDSIEGIPREERDLVAVTIGIDHEKPPLLKKRLNDFAMELHRDFSSEECNSLYQVNLNAFQLVHQKCSLKPCHAPFVSQTQIF